jgi:hypothetical protein
MSRNTINNMCVRRFKGLVLGIKVGDWVHQYLTLKLVNLFYLFFGGGGGFLPGAVGLLPLFGPEAFPVLLGAFAGVLPFLDM